ncbi:hypothetical protein SARC_06443, partial [Sphaeroforma arctica JP610]
AAVAELGSEKKEMEDRLCQLEVSNENSTELLASVKAAVAQAEGERDEAMAAHDNMKDIVTAAEQRVSTLEAELESAKAAVAEVESEKQSFGERLSLVTARESDSTQSMTDAQVQLTQPRPYHL